MRNAVLAGCCTFLVVAAAIHWAVYPERPGPVSIQASSPSCGDSPGDATARRSPADVAALLQSLHRQRDYEQLAPLIVADRREGSLALLRAIDGVLDANGSLQRAAEKAYSGPITETWSLASMADNVGPFSERICVIRQQLKGKHATVTLQAGDNIPLIHAEFELAGGSWQYRPEPSPARLTTELLALARILRSVEESVEYGAPFDTYYDSFQYRVLPQMARVVTAKDEAAGAVAAAAEE